MDVVADLLGRGGGSFFFVLEPLAVAVDDDEEGATEVDTVVKAEAAGAVCVTTI